MDECSGDLRCYEFDGYRLDATRRVITTPAGHRLVISPRVFDAALCFVQHPGEILSKEKLLAELWPGLVVEENGLTQLISILHCDHSAPWLLLCRHRTARAGRSGNTVDP